MSYLLGHYHHLVVIVLMMVGFYIVISRGNLMKKVIGLNIFQTSAILLYVTMGVVRGGTAPIFAPGFEIYSNPLPSVLMLTAIVVGVATTAVALALVVRIKEAYGSVEESQILDEEESAPGWDRRF